MISGITPPFSEQDIISVLKDLSMRVPVQTPVDIYIGGSAAFLLCADFRGNAGVVTGRKAKDIDFYVNDASYELIVPHLMDLGKRMSAHGGKEYYYPFDKDAGNFFLLRFLPEHQKYFFSPPSLQQGGNTGLVVQVLNERGQMLSKIEGAYRCMNTIRALQVDPRPEIKSFVKDEEHELVKNIADLSILARAQKIEGSSSLVAFWKQNSAIIKTQIEPGTVRKQWRMIEALRSAASRFLPS